MAGQASAAPTLEQQFFVWQLFFFVYRLVYAMRNVADRCQWGRR